MKKFWKDALKYGAIIGLPMAVAFIFEQWLSLDARMPLMLFVWVLAAVAYIVLLYRFTKQRRTAYYPVQEGFSFGQAFGFLFAMVVVVAVITGFAEFIYTNVVIGQPEFAERKITAAIEVLNRMDAPTAYLEQTEQQLEVLRTTPVTAFTIAWAAVWSLFVRLFFGCIVALILAGTLKREPEPFAHVE